MSEAKLYERPELWLNTTRLSVLSLAVGGVWLGLVALCGIAWWNCLLSPLGWYCLFRIVWLLWLLWLLLCL